MHIEDINAPLPYQVEGMYPSAGLVNVIRDGDGLLLDFASPDGTQAIRIAMFGLDAQRMLAELQRFVALLTTAVPSTPTSGSH